jgi:hypothetical protein
MRIAKKEAFGACGLREVRGGGGKMRRRRLRCATSGVAGGLNAIVIAEGRPAP